MAKVTIKIESEVHKAVKLHQVNSGLKSLSDAIQDLLRKVEEK